MNPGTFYSAASLLNPRAKQNKKKSSNGRPNPSPIPSIAPVPSAHALLNPKGSAVNKEKKHLSSDERSISEDTSHGRMGNLQTGTSTPFRPINSTSTAQPQFVFTDGNGANKDDADEEICDNSIGQAALLSKTHNIPNRDDQYAKRQKLSTTNGSSWIGSKGTSEVSKHLKEKKAEGIAEMNSAQQSDINNTAPIDLTEESDGDVVEVQSQGAEVEDEADSEEDESEQSKLEDPEVCIGQIDGALISVDRIPAIPKSSKILSANHWPSHRILLKKLGQRDLRITAFDCENKDFGTLGAQWAYPLSQAMNGKKVTRIVAILLNRKRRPGQRPGDPASDKVPAHILIYCKKSIALNLYKQLAKQKAPLRTPVGGDDYLEKINYYDVEVELYEEGGADTLTGAKVDPAALEKLEHDVFDVLSGIPEHNDLDYMEADPEIITTPLLDYQKQGLQFMTEQEVPEFDMIWEKDTLSSNTGAAGRSLWRARIDDKDNTKFLNLATGHVQHEVPVHMPGGLLADQMGLGKTLTMIALIASTIDEADKWCQENTGEVIDGIGICNVRTTLVVAPTSVLQNWEEQLKKHTAKDSLSVLKYHGPNRPTKLDDLTDYDVILTTYGTVQSEMSWRSAREKRRKSLFAHFKFYRVVLDEAHYIKAQTSDRARAIFNLHAERRWAITGTPIQNGLEDFGSILKFLRLAPFDRLFKQLVTLPAKREPEVVLGRMKLVFNSITLRRTKDKLTLPRNTKIEEKVYLRDDERHLYDRFTKEVNRKISSIANDDLSRNYMTFFTQLLSCRRICDSIDLLSKKELSLLDNSTANTDDELTGVISQDLSEEQAYKQLDTLREAMAASCSRCDKTLVKEPLDEADNQEICRFWDCNCFICPRCSAEFEEAVEDREKDGTFKCPVDDVIGKVKSVRLTLKRYMEHCERQLQQEQENVNDVARRYTKASSKTEALLKHLEEARQDDYTDGLPNKAVVFSYWSNYLDLLQIDLVNAGFKFLRLDGSVSQNKRVKILDSFNNDPEITVLISTIGVGGVGLNLQVANSVFVMEPQWNPAAEEQAVDRVHRLGQTREVTTVRFIVHDTVEVGVRLLARQKQALADLTTSKAKLKRSDVTAKVQELLSVLQRR